MLPNLDKTTTQEAAPSPFYYLSSFTQAFLIGASIPLTLYSTGQIKDLKMKLGKLETSGDAAWLMAAAQCGVVFGIGGLVLVVVKRRQSQA